MSIKPRIYTEEEQKQKIANEQHQRNVASYRKRIVSQLDNGGLSAIELQLSYLKTTTVEMDFSKFGIRQISAIEIMENCVADYKEGYQSLNIRPNHQTRVK